MPIRSGAIQRPSGCRCGNTLRQRYDDVGLPWRNTIGSPCPTSTYAMSLSKIRRRFFLYGNAVDIILASPDLCSKSARCCGTIRSGRAHLHATSLSVVHDAKPIESAVSVGREVIETFP